jgi:hypothetical protein
MSSNLPPFYLPLIIMLLATWGGTFLVGMWLGRPEGDRSRRLPRTAKLLMIASTLLWAGLWLTTARGTSISPYSTWIMLGLLAGSLGDLVLAGLFPLPHVTLPAMGLFGLGHFFYITACLAVITLLGLLEPSLWFVLTIGAVTAYAGWRLLAYYPANTPTLNSASLVYSLLLCLTAAFGVYIGFEVPGGWPIGAGLALFAVSDFILAKALFRKETFPYQRDIVWIIYSTGQMLIAYSIGLLAYTSR